MSGRAATHDPAPIDVEQQYDALFILCFSAEYTREVPQHCRLLVEGAWPAREDGWSSLRDAAWCVVLIARAAYELEELLTFGQVGMRGRRSCEAECAERWGSGRGEQGEGSRSMRGAPRGVEVGGF